MNDPQINLSNLNAEQLADLAQKARVLAHEKKIAEKNEKKKAFLETKQGELYRKTVQKLINKFRALPKQAVVKLTLPIKFTIRIQDEIIERFLNSCYGEEWFNYIFEGKFLSETCFQDKIQQKLLNSTLLDVSEAACSDCFKLFPQLRKQTAKALKDLKNLRERFNKDCPELSLADLLEQSELVDKL